MTGPDGVLGTSRCRSIPTAARGPLMFGTRPMFALPNVVD